MNFKVTTNDKAGWSFGLVYGSNWQNPFDHIHAPPDVRAQSEQEAADEFRAWLRGETRRDFSQRERIWLLNNIACLKGRLAYCESDLDAQVLSDVMDPDFAVPPFRIEDWFTPQEILKASGAKIPKDMAETGTKKMKEIMPTQKTLF